MRHRALLFLTGVFALALLQGCQALSRGRTQQVPATSRPTGVKVIVDGADAGVTPINLSLARKDVHVVRFELAGYRPVEIHVTKKRPPLGETILTSAFWAPIGGVVIGIPMFFIWEALHKDQPGEELEGLGRGLVSVLAGAVVGWVAGTTIDSGLPSNYDLLPQTILVEMEKADSVKGPVIVEIDPSRFEQTRWIRVAAR